jgi:hypothetical protein
MNRSQTQRDPQDSPWKQILRQYFREAIEFFFPAIAEVVDWTKPPEFLDKEFVQITPDAEIGNRFADQLVKVYRKRRKALILLIHIEIQATPEKHFSERIFVYSVRIFNYFHQHAISVAILCDANPRWRPNEYVFKLPLTELKFKFGTVKLLDYQDRWRELEDNPNPFAKVVMAHLKMQETKSDQENRKVWKMILIRQLYESGYNGNDIVNLFHFIDWLLKLPKHLEAEFWTELKAYEGERQMTYITSVEKIGFDKGKKEGKKEGRKEGKEEVALNLLRLNVPLETIAQGTGFTIAQLQQLQAEQK